MKECDSIQKRLAAFLDGGLSAEERKSIEEHLVSCDGCKESLEDLKKTQELLRGLPKVEPPPWFTQKVMKRVRDEAQGQKGLFRRLFYPLHIKIPAEVLATCLIAILVVYVYKISGPEMQMLQAPQETPVISQEQEKGSTVGSVEKPAAKKEASSRRAPEEEDRIGGSPPVLAVPEKSKIDEDRVKETPTPAASVETGEEQKITEEKDHPQVAHAEPKQEQKRSIYPFGALLKRSKDKATESRASGEAVAPAPSPQPNLITIFTKDSAGSAQEVDQLLARFKARNVDKAAGETPVFTALIPSGNLEAFLEALKPLGEIKKKDISPGPAGGDILIRLEIVSR